MKIVTQSKLVNIISNIKGSTIATLHTTTIPKMLKNSRTQTDSSGKIPNPYLDNIIKQSRYKVLVNFVYQNSVNNQRGREEKDKDFEVKSTWGIHETASIVSHKDQFYLSVKIEQTYDSEYFELDQGNILSVSELQQYLPIRYDNSRQGVDKQIRMMRVKFASIDRITIKGHTYQIKR